MVLNPYKTVVSHLNRLELKHVVTVMLTNTGINWA